MPARNHHRSIPVPTAMWIVVSATDASDRLTVLASNRGSTLPSRAGRRYSHAGAGWRNTRSLSGTGRLRRLGGYQQVDLIALMIDYSPAQALDAR